MLQYRLAHPALGFYVDATDLAEDSRDIGVPETPRDAVRAALGALGEPYATEMAEGIEVVDGRPSDT